MVTKLNIIQNGKSASFDIEENSDGSFILASDYEALKADRDAQPVELHMGVAMEVFDTLHDAMLSSRVEHSELGAMGATKIEVWSSKIGALLEMHHGNGGCTLKVYTAPPAPAVPGEYEIFTQTGGVKIAVKDGVTKNQLYGLGWNACRAAMLAQPVSHGYKLDGGWISCS